MNHEVTELISDTLKWIQESDFHSNVLLTSEENALFFSSPKMETKQEPKKLVAPIYSPSTPKAKVFKEERKPAQPPVIKQEPSAEPIRKIIEKVHPYFPLANEVPDDALAKKKAESWKENGPLSQVVILYFGESPGDLEFLKKLAKAIHTSYASTKLIDARRISNEKRWDLFLKEGNYKLIIAPEKGVQTSFDLMRRYTEIPKTQARFLGKTPLLLLSAPDQYQKSPHLKRTLWSTLCQILKS
ncbi:MAG TPA: hypothetical protein VLG76_05210 [Rhabdochlamydiaceae bacterium]|nr:hypothetical protein [Rhabdochlamydiaceae bacterium]